jgi:hypothetical protein
MALRTKLIGLIVGVSRKKTRLWYIARVREMKSYYKTLFGQNFKGTHDEGKDLIHRYLVEEKIILKWILKKNIFRYGDWIQLTQATSISRILLRQ